MVIDRRSLCCLGGGGRYMCQRRSAEEETTIPVTESLNHFRLECSCFERMLLWWGFLDLLGDLKDDFAATGDVSWRWWQRQLVWERSVPKWIINHRSSSNIRRRISICSVYLQVRTHSRWFLCPFTNTFIYFALLLMCSCRCVRSTTGSGTRKDTFGKELGIGGWITKCASNAKRPDSWNWCKDDLNNPSV